MQKEICRSETHSLHDNVTDLNSLGWQTWKHVDC